MNKFSIVVLFFALLLSLNSCDKAVNTNKKTRKIKLYSNSEGINTDFKVPLPPGYNWEVTQSWHEHCGYCENKYPDINYCSFNGSHSDITNQYALDFSLPGNTDYGKPVLATGNGTVFRSGWSSQSGNFIMINHGDDICSQYNHLKDNSTNHLSVGDDVCQGLKIGEIGDSQTDNAHLHFVFVSCSTGESKRIKFTDGNSIVKCTRGDDIFDNNGKYTALKLTNTLKYSCDGNDFPDTDSTHGWAPRACGSLPNCPLRPNCTRSSDYKFSDVNYHNRLKTGDAISYLYSECVIDGKTDGKFHPEDDISRAEALKIALKLFGLDNNCGVRESFTDVRSTDWFYNYVNCGIKHNVINSSTGNFRPNDPINFVEAAKILVTAGEAAGLIDFKNSDERHFNDIPKSHWAYTYAETLYYYGGLARSSEFYTAGQIISREDYALMTAHLSPCFCANIDCELGCSCNQANYACSDGDETTDIGGGSDEEFSLQCYIDEDKNECIDDNVVLYIKCKITNNRITPLRVNNLTISLTDPEELDDQRCIVTDSTVKNEGVGSRTINPGETESPGGHFEITCPSNLSLSSLEIEGMITERISGEGNINLDNEIFAEIDLNNSMLDICSAQNNCISKTCSGEGLECGQLDNGCGGQVDCGNCGDGQICIANKCQTPECTPTNSCSANNCGLINDGCGNMINCGNCTNGKTCNNNYCETPTCIPLTCNSDQGIRCGLINDGCGGTITCGRCGQKDTCTSEGYCVRNDQYSSCEDSNYDCGWQYDFASGYNYCGECQIGQFCNWGHCVDECTPNTEAMIRQSRQCGSYDDGCGTMINLGDCSDQGKFCNPHGQCVDECVPKTCNYKTALCGVIDDGCGGQVDCGNCVNGYNCAPNGMCVEDDQYSTCEDSNYECGWRFDFSGGKNYCGECPSGLSCSWGHCVANCVPTSLETFRASRECGTYDDSCGNMVNIGECDDGKYCNRQGQCVDECVPKTCIDILSRCGDYDDGCGGHLYCGSCMEGNSCINGACIPSCEKNLCSLTNKECGTITNSCGETLNCGTCNDGETCSDGVCTNGCVPITCDGSFSRQCGTQYDGCGGILNCGSCEDGKNCLGNHCFN